MSEAVYTLEFQLQRGALSAIPDTVRRAGVWGDHRAAQLRFTLKDAPLDRQYRVEVCDGGGGYDITDLLTPQNGVVTLAVPAAWTTPGIATLRLVEIAVENGNEEQVYHYPAVRVQFDGRADGDPAVHLPCWQQVMTATQELAATAVAAATDAAEHTARAAAFAKEAAEYAASAQELGEIGEALDSILAMQEQLIGGMADGNTERQMEV